MYYWLAMIITIVTFVSSSCLLTKYKKIVKYIPMSISLLFGILNMYMAKGEHNIIALMRISLAVICMVGFLSGFVTAMIIDIIIPITKKRKQKKV